MAIPNAEEARRILVARRLPAGVVAHSEGVARVAAEAARRLDDMARRYPGYRTEIDAARRPAHALEQELADAIGLPVDDLVDQLRAAWQAPAAERAGR